MEKLISKVQYIHFEAGEFVEERLRTYDETIKLIESFPWQAQRHGLRVGLTNPSVTLSFDETNYLKIATYFNGKYVIYYWEESGAVYIKSFVQLSETFGFVSSFFDDGKLDATMLKRHLSKRADNRLHFVSQSFVYEATPQRCQSYLFDPIQKMFYFLILFTLVVWAINGMGAGALIIYLLVSLAVLLFMYLPNVLLVWNYYRFAKGKVLQISKGNQKFSYGDRANPVQYYKEDIAVVKMLKNTHPSAPWKDFALYKVEFKDGSVIKIPTLFVDYDLLFNKFPPTLIKVKHRSIPLVKTEI